MDKTIPKRAKWEPIAKKIRFLLYNESVAMEEVAERLGVTREHLRYVLDGVSRPTKHFLEKICAVFNVRMEFFGSNIGEILTGEIGEIADEEAPRAAATGRPTSRGGTDGKAGAPEDAEKADQQKKKRKFDLAEMAAHHQALLECLFAKKVFRPDEYEAKLQDVRSRAGLE